MIKRKTTSLIALLLVVLLSLSMAGCSQKQEPAEKPSENKEGVVPRPEGLPEDYPNKEITFIYAFSAGSPLEAYIRILGDKMQEMQGWKNGVVISFKEGASGRIGWNASAEAEPDGYFTGFAPSAMLISAVSEDVSYGVDKLDFIFNTMSDPGAIGVITGSPYKTLGDLVQAAKENPGKISVGVTSVIGQEGLTIKMIERAAGVDFNEVAFDGEGAIFAAVLGKHLDAFCLNVSDATSFIEDKSITILATGDSDRSPFLPDVPTYKEAGYDVTQVNMRAVSCPKGTPEPIRKYLEECFIAAANDPEVAAKAAEMKLPIDTLPGDEVKAIFTQISEGYAKLWAEDPWN